MKNLEITKGILKKLRKSVGEDVDLNGISVYETIALNTMPISKKNTVFDGGVHTRSTLVSMANYVNDYPGGVPLQVMHDNRDLPVGKLFYAEVRDAGQGYDELRGLFYVSNDSDTKIKSNLDKGIIDEVSVGIRHKHVFCSECEFDYLGDSADWENLWTATCANDHVIGEDGCHARLVGVETFHELSLVNRGAANKAKIVGPSQALLSQEHFQQLAASGRAPQEQCLFAIKTKIKKEKDVADKGQMGSLDLNALVGELTDLKAAKGTFETELKSLKDQVAEKDAVIEKLQASVTELNAEKDMDKTEALADLELANTFIRDVAKRSLVATGSGADSELPEKLSDVIMATKEAQSKLSAMIPVGGVSLDSQSGDNDGQNKNPASLQAFKLKKG